MIKIGVSACLFHPDPDRLTFSKKTLSYLENDMATYLTRPNVLPILIPAFKSIELLKHFCQQMDGFVFQGGVDVCPESYHQPYLDKNKWPGDKIRDNYELEIMDFSYHHKKPALGICRGLQLMNSYFGGTLYQDINTQVETSIEHRNAAKYDEIYHEVVFDNDSLLANKIHPGLKGGLINTVHHQSVNKLGKDLIREAYCPQDNVLEAFRHKTNDNFIYAVQWHPEFGHTLKDKVINSDSVYDYFLTQI